MMPRPCVHDTKMLECFDASRLLLPRKLASTCIGRRPCPWKGLEEETCFGVGPWTFSFLFGASGVLLLAFNLSPSLAHFGDCSKLGVAAPATRRSWAGQRFQAFCLASSLGMPAGPNLEETAFAPRPTSVGQDELAGHQRQVGFCFRGLGCVGIG